MDAARRRIRLLLLVAVALGAGAIGVAGWGLGVLRSTELASVDSRFDIRGDRPPPRDVVVVAIDAASFTALQQQWPFPRSLHGKLIDRLSEAGARAIAYDVQFSEPTKPAEDGALIDAVRRSGRVVLATTEVDRRGRSNVFGGPAVVRQARARVGDASLLPDSGGVVRRVAHSPQGLESFAVATVEMADGREIDRSEFPGSSAWIDYHGPPGTIQRIPFSRVLRGQVDPRVFRDKIVAVGAVAPSLQDVHATSVGGGSLMPGVELQANAISTVRRNLPLSEWPGALDVILIVLMGAVAPVASLRLRAPVALGIGLLAGLLLAGAAQLAFNGGLILPFVHPLVSLVLGMVGALSVGYVNTVYDRQRVRELFARFVPDRVVDEVIERADGARLGGEELECTVMFTDLRGFTTFSESMHPERVIEALNRFHSQMCEAIMGKGGTIVSYMGDGIMAVFGAPLPTPDHADQGLAAAREMIGPRIGCFNEWLRSEGLCEGFEMGVGLNSGLVMSGNIGAERRLEFTVIGDTVNTASRLEGMTKGTPHQLFIADSTRSRLGNDASDLVFVGELAVRGRQDSVKVWSVAGDRDEAPACKQGEPVAEESEPVAEESPSMV